MNKKIIISIITIIVIIAIISGIGIFILIQNQTKPEEIWEKYIRNINEQKYEEMYNMIIPESREKITQENFIARNKNIYNGIDMVNMKIEIKNIEKENRETRRISYKSEMDTAAGKIEFTNTVRLKKDKEAGYLIDWDSSLIFPQLENTDKVRIKTITAERGEIIDKNGKILAGKGEKNTRTYPLGEAAAHLIGYVQSITAEELEKNRGKGYRNNSTIGKTGLEKKYEERLKGKDGIELYIEDSEGKRKTEIAKIEAQKGEQIKLTIDSEIQNKLYNELKENQGFFVVMHPKTGEIIAIVSTPSYNPNDFVQGMSNEKWKSITENPNNPMMARYTKTWCPGSTFKPITGAIGLSTDSLKTDDTFTYSGLSWKKEGWGEHDITTLTAYNGPKNLENAIIHSDNIYFAQAAIQIGKQNIINGLNKIKFREELDLEISTNKSQYSNSGEIENEKKLADSGYGQGEILVNPIHMASIYSAFANEGNMVKPYIEVKENNEVEYLVKDAFTKEAAEIIKADLIQVVESPEGTANDMKVTGRTIAGKTGTAELKVSKDAEGETLGWFNCFTTDEKENQFLVISMVENGTPLGGSHYLIKKIKTLF